MCFMYYMQLCFHWKDTNSALLLECSLSVVMLSYNADNLIKKGIHLVYFINGTRGLMGLQCVDILSLN